MTLELVNVTADRSDLFQLLKEAYDRIYVPAFPDPNEREDFDKFISAIKGGIAGVGITVNIVGENLEDPARRVLKGMSVAYYYEAQNVGLLAYNAISPEHQGGGIGKVLVQSRINSLKDMAAAKGKKLDGAFIEVNDPRQVKPEDDSMDPLKRISLFTKWGARLVPIDYAQPPLSDDGAHCEQLLLMSYPVDGKYASRNAIEKFLRGIYKEGRVNHRPETDPVFVRMVHELKNLPDSALPDPKETVVPGYAVGTPPVRVVSKVKLPHL